MRDNFHVYTRYCGQFSSGKKKIFFIIFFFCKYFHCFMSSLVGGLVGGFVQITYRNFRDYQLYSG